jgi:hypothetical protein
MHHFICKDADTAQQILVHEWALIADYFGNSHALPKTTGSELKFLNPQTPARRRSVNVCSENVGRTQMKNRFNKDVIISRFPFYCSLEQNSDVFNTSNNDNSNNHADDYDYHNDIYRNSSSHAAHF